MKPCLAIDIANEVQALRRLPRKRRVLGRLNHDRYEKARQHSIARLRKEHGSRVLRAFLRIPPCSLWTLAHRATDEKEL